MYDNKIKQNIHDVYQILVDGWREYLINTTKSEYNLKQARDNPSVYIYKVFVSTLQY